MIHYLLIKEILMLLSLISSTMLGIILVDYQDLKDELKENIEYYGEDEKTTFKNKLLFKKIKCDFIFYFYSFVKRIKITL